MSDIEGGKTTAGDKVAAIKPGGISDGASYGERLAQCAHSDYSDEANFLLFRSLQRANLIHLQNKLIKCQAALRTASDETMADLDSTLERYANALRNYEYMTKFPESRSWEFVQVASQFSAAFPEMAILPDAFDSEYLEYRNFTGSGSSPPPLDPIQDWLRKHLPRKLAWATSERLQRRSDYSHGRLPQELSPFVDHFARAIFAVCGGATLLVPMIVMSLHPSLAKSLITVSVAIVLFAILLSEVFIVTYSDILTFTMAYAAVLVVFVGNLTVVVPEH